MPDLRGISNFCARYSLVGLLFMVMVAMMLTYQPFYIGGIEHVESATRNAYGAIATFLLTFILSVVYLVQDALKGGSDQGGFDSASSRRRSGNDYDGVPTNMMMAGGADTTNYDLPLSVEQASFT
mmetsp:Transcript_9843/g.15789  ORF Transcript_9843/g.15789 Transcript_9843/m.15789 type:complete len:125 (+) Transcript_9843:142-516(+)